MATALTQTTHKARVDAAHAGKAGHDATPVSELERLGVEDLSVQLQKALKENQDLSAKVAAKEEQLSKLLDEKDAQYVINPTTGGHPADKEAATKQLEEVKPKWAAITDDEATTMLKQFDVKGLGIAVPMADTKFPCWPPGVTVAWSRAARKIETVEDPDTGVWSANLQHKPTGAIAEFYDHKGAGSMRLYAKDPGLGSTEKAQLRQAQEDFCKLVAALCIPDMPHPYGMVAGSIA